MTSTPFAASRPKGRAEISTVAIAFLFFIVIGLPSGYLGVAWPSMQKTFALPIDDVAKLLLVNTIFYTLASFISGQLAVRLGMVRYLLLMGALNVAGSLAQAFVPSWGLFILFAVLAGFGNGGIDTGFNWFMANRYKATILNWLHACFGIGATLGPIIITAIITSGGYWGYGYLVVAILQALLMVAVAVTSKYWDLDHVPGGGPKPETPLAKPSLKATLILPSVWLAMLVFFVYTGAEITSGQWAYTLFTEGRGISAAAAALWTSIYWGSFTLGRMTLGMVIDRFGVIPILRICMVGCLVGAVMLWWAPVAWIGFAGLALLGWCFAPIFPTLVSNTPTLLGKEHGPNAIGLQIGTAGLGYAALPGVAGMLAKTMGIEILGPYLLIACVLMFGLFEGLVRLKKS